MSQRGQMGEIWSRSDGLDGFQARTEEFRKVKEGCRLRQSGGNRG